MDQPKIDRLLRLMKMLTANTNYSVADISDKLDMSIRTVYRYIDTFREAGFVIKKDGEYFRLDKSSKYFKDISQLVHFTDEEAYILKSAIESIDENNVIKQNLKKKLYSVYDYKLLADCVVKKENSANVHNLVDAIENKQSVILENYHSAHTRHISNRKVEPFAFTTNYIYLWAYEPESGQNKLFKISRIGSVNQLGGWQFESLHKVGYVDIFRMNGFKEYPIILQLNFRASTLLVEEFPLAEQALEQISEDKWLLRTKVSSFDGVGRFVLGLSNDIKIIESQEFKDYIAVKNNGSTLLD